MPASRYYWTEVLPFVWRQLASSIADASAYTSAASPGRRVCSMTTMSAPVTRRQASVNSLTEYPGERGGHLSVGRGKERRSLSQCVYKERDGASHPITPNHPARHPP